MLILMAVSSGLAVFFAVRARYWKRRYLRLLDDAFERGARAVSRP